MSIKMSHNNVVVLCSIANFINAADRVIMPIAIIPMTTYFKWTLHWQGWILSAFAFGYLSSQVFGAYAAKKFGGKAILLLSVFLWSMSTVATPWVSHNTLALILCRVISGFGEGLGLPTIFHIFANNIAVTDRSSAFGYLVAAGSVGQTVASVICPHLMWQTSFYFFGSIGILWSLIWISLYSENEYGRNDELPLISIPDSSRIRIEHWRNFFIHWPLWAIYIAHFTMNWSNYIIMHWLPTYLRSLGASPHNISLTAVPYIFNSVFGIVAGNYADKLIDHRWSVLTVRRLMTTIGLVGPAIFLLLFCTMNSLSAAIIFISISMGLCACNSAGHLSNHAEVAPNHAGITFSISNTLATIPGILCGPLTAELVMSSHGRWFPVFLLAAALNFTGSIIYCSQSSTSQILVTNQLQLVVTDVDHQSIRLKWKTSPNISDPLFELDMSNNGQNWVTIYRGFRTSFYVEYLSGNRNYVFRLRLYESNDAANAKFVQGLWLCAMERSVITKDDPPSINAFHHSARQNLPLLFHKFLDTRAKDVNVYNEQGECALSKACAAGNGDMVLTMIRHGADANLPSMFAGTTPLMTAAYHGHCDIIRILAHNDADAAARDMSVPRNRQGRSEGYTTGQWRIYGGGGARNEKHNY